MPLVTREQAVGAMRARVSAMDARVREQQESNPPPEDVPPHVRALADLWTAMGRTERAWVVELVERTFAGAGGYGSMWTDSFLDDLQKALDSAPKQ